MAKANYPKLFFALTMVKIKGKFLIEGIYAA